MARLPKFGSVLLVTLGAISFVAPPSDAAPSAAIRKSCREQAEKIYPPNTGDIAQGNRSRRDLVRSCIRNGGKIPG